MELLKHITLTHWAYDRPLSEIPFWLVLVGFLKRTCLPKTITCDLKPNKLESSVTTSSCLFVSLCCENRCRPPGQHSHTLSCHSSVNLWEQWPVQGKKLTTDFWKCKVQLWTGCQRYQPKNITLNYTRSSGLTPMEDLRKLTPIPARLCFPCDQNKYYTCKLNMAPVCYWPN